MDTLTTVIPVYNGEKYIRATLESVAAQTRRPDRVIVLDNCSTDSTRQIVSEFAKVRCEWIQNPRNFGLFGNLNRALQFASQTDFLHLLHADDLVLPRFYEETIKALRSVSGRGLVFCAPQFINQDGDLLDRPRVVVAPAIQTLDRREFMGRRAELQPIYFPCILLKTDRQPAPVSFPEDMPHMADHVFWAGWAKHSIALIELPEKLAQYRFHPLSLSSRHRGQLQEWVMDEWRAMDLISREIDETSLQRWVRLQKLKMIFAARCHVKVGMVKGSPESQRSIRALAYNISSRWRYAFASVVVVLRDFIFLSLRIEGSLPP